MYTYYQVFNVKEKIPDCKDWVNNWKNNIGYNMMKILSYTNNLGD